MKKYLLLLGAVLGLLAFPALAATCTTAICRTDGTLTVNSGGAITANSGSTVTLGGTNTISGTTTLSGAAVLTGSVNPSGLTYSTALTGNPLMQNHYEAISVAALNSVKTVLASSTGKSIYVGGGLTAYASGSLATATAITIKCSGGSTIVSWPAALLTDGAVVGAFSSTAVTRGTALTSGCPAGEAILVSPTGTATTTTQFMVNLPYGWQ